MGMNGVEHALHYLDVYLFFGVPSTRQCEQAFRTAFATCERLGVLVYHRKKVEGPATDYGKDQIAI